MLGQISFVLEMVLDTGLRFYKVTVPPHYLDIKVTDIVLYLYPFVLRKAKIVCSFGLSECNRVKAFVYKYVDK